MDPTTIFYLFIMITWVDLVYILANLPRDIVKHIVAGYYPLCFFIMDDNWLLNYNWNSQSKLVFGMTCDDFYSYYCLCLRYDVQYINRDIAKIACGYFHTVILKTDGTLIGTGYNNYLGLEPRQDSICNFTSMNVKDVAQVACGWEYTMVLKADHTLLACGYNNTGHLGLCDAIRRDTFTEVTLANSNGQYIPFPKDVVQIACGTMHTMILRANGTLMSCGFNGYGQLGHDDYNSREIFTEIKGLPRDIVSVVCGANYTYILRANGTLMSCGNNKNFQLGNGDTKCRLKFEEVIDMPKNILQVACGESHTIILTTNGELMGCGSNDNGQMDSNTYGHFKKFTKLDMVKRPIRIACGDNHTFVVAADGLFGYGLNKHGQLGTSKDKRSNIIYCGDVQIVCGFCNTFIVKSDGTLMGCGENTYGQLGLGFKDLNLTRTRFRKIHIKN